jgi:hypothetical protein
MPSVWRHRDGTPRLVWLPERSAQCKLMYPRPASTLMAARAEVYTLHSVSVNDRLVATLDKRGDPTTRTSRLRDKCDTRRAA